MIIPDHLKLWLIAFLIIHNITAEISLAPDTYWDQHGLTVAGWINRTNGSAFNQLNAPYGISITDNDVLYIADSHNHRIIVVSLNSTSDISFIGSVQGTAIGQFNGPFGLFIKNTSLYVLDSINHRVQRMFLNGSNPSIVLNLNVSYWSSYIYVDTDDNIYLSIINQHLVLMFPSNGANSTVVAGTGVLGNATDQLNRSYGIFVDKEASIYVADCYNHRVMKWQLRASSGTIAAGTGVSGAGLTQLNYPTDIIVDINGFMYISEAGNSRITRWAPNSNTGICIVACVNAWGIGSTELHGPHSLTFDKSGSLYVGDWGNHRIQKFQILHKPSYNQPKFSVCATWDQNATTVANSSAIGTNTTDIFIDINNNIYVADRNHHRVLIWSPKTMSVPRTISDGLNTLYSVFASISGDIYVDNGLVNHRIDLWTKNATSSVPAMNVTSRCFDLFIDVNASLYCSNDQQHQIVKMSLRNGPNPVIIVAGNRTAGSLPHMLNSSNGIYVDTNFDLYVADWGNDRVQLFRRGERNGTTVAGTSGTILLSRPTAVVLDADRNLFISDSKNHRIIRSGPGGFHCLLGCFGGSYSTSYHLSRPYALSFDTDGNLFVADYGNARIQKFPLRTNSCVPSYNRPKFASCAAWNSNGTTIANVTLTGMNPMDMFVDANDAVYIANRFNNSILVWSERNAPVIRNLSPDFNSSLLSIFVTVNGDIYTGFDFGGIMVDMWTLNRSAIAIIGPILGECVGLFFDRKDYIYCSTGASHRVVKFLWYNSLYELTLVAGNGTAGSGPIMLNEPQGIFVDTNLDVLYVADCYNNRIQFFPSGQLNGTTIVINGSNGIFTLACPAEVILDMDGYLFIADNHHNRILGEGPMGFRCIVGCTGTKGSASDQLYFPHSLGFDSKGNLFVIEFGNNRLQKFSLSSNSCEETTTYLTDTSTAEQTSIVTTSTVITDQSCSRPVIKLIPSTSSLLSPLSFRRSQDFYLSSYIQLSCNKSLSKIIEWTIHNCTSMNCSSQIQLDPTVQTTFSELYIPARILPYGIYQLKLTVTMIASPMLSASSSAYVRITPSSIITNLVQYGTSVITRGYAQDLTLDPGTFSVDPDRNVFDSTDWKYKYYCRIYGYSPFPHLNGSLLTIDDPNIDRVNSSCLSSRTDNQPAWKFNDLIQSSLTIFNRSLLPNRTYQFMVQMENRHNSSIQTTGYLLVRVDDTHPQLIVVACVISTICVPNVEFQLINPTTQVALFSLCQGNCSLIHNITWNLYCGLFNASTNFTKWVLFNNTASYEDVWFFGRNTANFTATSQLFRSYARYNRWQFEVIYTFASEQSSSALNFIINQPPQNGSCCITPLNGTTTTLFTISCSDWLDEDGIKSYSLYSTKAKLIAFSSISEFEVHLPCENGNTSQIDLFISIRDTLDSITELNLTSVFVTADPTSISFLMDTFHHSPDSLSTNSIVQLLSAGNQNTVGQILTSISQQFNQINMQSIDNAVANGVPAASISISSLLTETVSTNQSSSLNTSALIDYERELNSYAEVRDYLMQFAINLLISTPQSIILQTSSLVQMTDATNQLTRSAAIMVSERCYQLAQVLHAMSTRILYEDLRSAITQLTQCTSNVLTAINGPLQSRTRILSLDPWRANQLPVDYDTDLEMIWSNLNLFADGSDFSWEIIEKNRNVYYQKQAADQIHDRTSKTMALLTAALNIHLNIDQNYTLNTSSAFMLFKSISSKSLSEKIIEGIGTVRIDLPSNFNSTEMNDQILSLRLIVQPLASSDSSSVQSHTNLSRSVSFAILDRDGNEKSLSTPIDHPYRFVIPRDPTMVLSPMILQNVTSLHNLTLHVQYIAINQTNNLTNSIHIEIKPLNNNVAYFFIARFDHLPQMNNLTTQSDRWLFLCPVRLTNDQMYRIFFNNQQTKDHQSLIFGLRELNATEFKDYCSNNSTDPIWPRFQRPFHFTINYELRVYSSGCYFLDENNHWKSDGLIVGPLTNSNETECFSTFV